MKFTTMQSPLDIKNTPRNLFYKQNSIRIIQDLNDELIPDDMDEIPNRIYQSKILTQSHSASTEERGSSPYIRNSQRTSSFASIISSTSPSRRNFNRSSQKHATAVSFIQRKLNRLNNSQQPTLLNLNMCSSVDNSSSIEGITEKQSATQYSSPSSSQFKRKTNNHFTEYYKNAIIEYID